MNETETNYSSGNPETGGVRNELESLRVLVAGALLVVFIGSMCVNVFFYRQVKAMGGQLNELQGVVTRYQTTGATQVIEFWTRLNDYSRTHPDFNPIIAKYSPYIALHTNAPAAGQPAAAAPASKKK